MNECWGAVCFYARLSEMMYSTISLRHTITMQHDATTHQRQPLMQQQSINQKAKYGFIDTYSPCTFWKYMDIIPSTELTAIGLSYSRMLFYPTGDISPEIFDVLTYIILGEKNRQEQKVFYDACLNGDEDTKSTYLNEYYYEIYGRIKKHVDKFLKDLDELEAKAIRVDEESHPRIEMIREHNEFVKEIFLAVKDNVDAVMSEVT